MNVGEIARGLPIAAIVPDLLERETDSKANLVIEAPPGAGKTTVVPIALLQAMGDAPGTIIVVQPRRLAARLSALRVASLLGESIGERVGYSVRFDRVVSARTRILFVTEGVLLRQLRGAEGEPSAVATVILDEFHERSLDGDLLLALLRRAQRRGSGPRLVVMSATLDGEPVANYLGARRLRSEGRSFPVEVEYPKPSRSRGDEPPLDRKVAAAVHELVERGLIGRASPGGHALVFLPGSREIRACAERCAGIAERAGLAVHVLHGSLAKELQDRAVTGPGDKLILATNVAETSITIDGVVAVIDSGLARVAGVDPGTGMPRLELAPISRASAAQRAGRAGRTRPGVCLRLYGKHDHDHRPAFDMAEIRRLDLTGAVLELAAAGIHVDHADDFAWFEEPPEAALASATRLLRQLEAIDDQGALTEVGREMLRYPLHPRLARLLHAAVGLGVGESAATIAALLAAAWFVERVSDVANPFAGPLTWLEAHPLLLLGSLALGALAARFAHASRSEQLVAEPSA
ncbi:MAG: ATP-dependent RNA helicase [Myxococcales bacterium]|nr:ATP-dependent RNA helicase [Myxococcales bacterium]